jgi:hypothetical protein
VLVIGLGLAGAAPRGHAQFTDVTTPLLADPGAGFGVAWCDYDRDGDQDIYISNGGGGPSKLFRNDAGTFVDATTGPLSGVGGEFGVAWGDYDDDGDLDLFSANGTVASRLLRNEGGVFADVDAGDAGIPGPAQSAAWADYDQDGDLDLYVTCWDAPNRLFRNDGGVFVNATPPGMDDSGKGTGAAWADYDNDGDLDIYVGNRTAGQLFRNEGGGAFTDVTVSPLNKAGITGVAWADYDNDGDLDLYVCRDLVSNRLFRNNSTDTTTSFTDMYIPAMRDAGFSQGCTWADFDNDGDLDLFVVNAGVNNGEGDKSSYIVNLGGGAFGRSNGGVMGYITNSRGVAAGDYDNDGFVDLYTVNWFEPNTLFRKFTVAGNHWLHLDLVGTDSNSSAIGARVRIVAGGQQQIREVSGGSGIYSQNSLTVEFGLGPTTTVDTVEVLWPSGIVTDTTDIAADQKLKLYETAVVVGVGDRAGPATARLYANMPNPFRSSTVIRYDLLEPSPVEVRIVDLSGRLVRVLEQVPQKNPGTYELVWNGRGEDGQRLAQGIYFYSLRAAQFRKSSRMVLLR